MNLSAWSSYSPDQQELLKAEIVQQVKSRAMPPRQYTMVHWNANITDPDVQALQQWVRQDTSSVSVVAVGGSGDATRGREVFEKRCTGCHALETNREGPRLKGIYGQASGSVPGFTYSEALRKSHLVWNDATLDQWLADPDKLVPGNDMEFHVAKPDERLDLIRFLKQSSGK
jgi:cytochrome c